MVSFIVVIAGLSLLIFAHEAGHFLVARFFGFRVDEFGFGIPPRIVGIWRASKGATEAGKKRGIFRGWRIAWNSRVASRSEGTIYSLNWIPFGGFVRLFGEEGGESALLFEDGKGNVDEVGQRRPAQGTSFSEQAVWRRMGVIVAGVIVNFLVGWLLISSAFMIGTPSGVIISVVRENSPASVAGIKEGDIMVGFGTTDEFAKYIDENRGKVLDLQTKRGSEKISVTITPRVHPPEGEGPIGVGLMQGGERLGFVDAVREGFLTTVAIIGLVFQGLFSLIYRLILGEPNLTGVMGPVGIVATAGQAGKLGFVYILNLLALVSINLAAINLIPFPALDGGRLFFLVIEKIKGSPLPARFERAVNGIGFFFLLALILALTVRDISHLI